MNEHGVIEVMSLSMTEIIKEANQLPINFTDLNTAAAQSLC